jgi:hypothetical protein
VLNVTSPPWNIDSSGRTDVTIQLQKAIKSAYNHFEVVYLPLGTYLVSATLTAFDPDHWSVGINNTYPCRFQPNAMIGERAVPDGSGGLRRPLIVLKDNSSGFGDR